jgi:peptidoglycan/xylan/chitin deacetylase (PgdA/CDA1 family)
MSDQSFPVLLTFDLDAESGALARDPANATRPVTLSVGQYGPHVAVPRILGVLREQAVPATFFVPGWVVDKYPESIEAVLKDGHELAHHGYEHVPPALQTPDEEEASLSRGVESIRKLSGSAPQGYRSPSWEVSGVTLDLLVRYGFRYSSNFMGDDRPYVHTGPGKGLVELPIQWMLDDFPFFGVVPNRGMYGIATTSAAYDVWTEELAALHAEEGRTFVLTMHPQCIGRASRVAMLSRLIDYARGLGKVDFLRCADLAARVRA